MIPRLFALLAIISLLANEVSVLASPYTAARLRHQQLNKRRPLVEDIISGPQAPPPIRKRKSCEPRQVPDVASTSVSEIEIKTTISLSSTKSTPKPTGTSTSNSGGSPLIGASTGNSLAGLIPLHVEWPSQTQAGAAPASSVTSAADPFLLELSKAYNNADNELFTKVHTGQMTY